MSYQTLKDALKEKVGEPVFGRWDLVNLVDYYTGRLIPDSTTKAIISKQGAEVITPQVYDIDPHKHKIYGPGINANYFRERDVRVFLTNITSKIEYPLKPGFSTVDLDKADLEAIAMSYNRKI